MEFVGQTGTFESTLDEKGRVVIPVSLRDSYTGKLKVMRGVEFCIWVMTSAAYENFMVKFKKERKIQGLSSEEIQAFQYQHESTTQTVEIDPKSGRIPVPAALRTYANLTRDCLVVSINGHLEIWNAELYTSFMNEIQAINKNIHRKMDFFTNEEDL